MLLITKFNKLIRSKLIWSVIAGIIIVSFVWMGAAGNNTDVDPRQQRGEGTLFGDAVSFRTFQLARAFELGFQDGSDLTEEENSQLKKRVWTRLALLGTAKRMGITSSREDVLASIQNDPMFQSEAGTFDRTRFNVILNRYLKVPESVFYQYKDQEVVMKQLLDLLYASVWASPFEIMRNMGDLADIITVEYVTIPTEDITDDVKVKRKDIEAFYAENKELFTIPKQINVKYVTFPFSSYTAIASAQVTDDQVEEYYNDNIADYWITDTNSTNSATIQTPFEDVKDDIRVNIETSEAVFAARDAAMDFVVAIAPDRHGDAPDFSVAAASSVLTVHTSALFSASETPEGLLVGPDFTETAFRLNPVRIDEYFSDPIKGEDAVYVLAANETADARIPELDEVSDLAKSLAQASAEQKAIEETSAEIRNSLQNKIFAGKSLADAADDLDLDVVTTEPFTVYMGPLSNDFDHAESIMQAVTSLKQGELAESPITVEDARLILYIAKREPVDFTTMQMLKPRVQASMDQYRTQLLFAEWGQHALKTADFTDHSAPLEQEEAPSEP
jgi:hypothetical protein